MSKIFLDYSKDIDAPEEQARRQAFIERMTRKLEYKESLQAPSHR